MTEPPAKDKLQDVTDGDMAQPDPGLQRDLMGSIEGKDGQALELEKQLESDRKKYEDNIRQKDGILERQAKEILELRSKEQAERLAKEKAVRNRVRAQLKQADVAKLLITYGGKEDMVKLLLDQGANIEAKDDDGDTPLISAIRIGNGNAGVVKLLLDRGADVEVEDEYGNTPLQFAKRQGYEDVVKLLLDRGAGN
ncbi:ankyrin repeat-containing domain protein [Trichoderma compactum]